MAFLLTDDASEDELRDAAQEQRELSRDQRVQEGRFTSVRVGKETWRVRTGSIAEAMARYAAANPVEASDAAFQRVLRGRETS